MAATKIKERNAELEQVKNDKELSIDFCDYNGAPNKDEKMLDQEKLKRLTLGEDLKRMAQGLKDMRAKNKLLQKTENELITNVMRGTSGRSNVMDQIVSAVEVEF